MLENDYVLPFKALNQHCNDTVKWLAHSNKNMVVESDCKVVNSSLLTSHYIISMNIRAHLWMYNFKPAKSKFNLHIFKIKLAANIKYNTVFQRNSFHMPSQGMYFKFLLLDKSCARSKKNGSEGYHINALISQHAISTNRCLIFPLGWKYIQSYCDEMLQVCC